MKTSIGKKVGGLFAACLGSLGAVDTCKQAGSNYLDPFDSPCDPASAQTLGSVVLREGVYTADTIDL